MQSVTPCRATRVLSIDFVAAAGSVAVRLCSTDTVQLVSALASDADRTQENGLLQGLWEEQ